MCGFMLFSALLLALLTLLEILIKTTRTKYDG